VYKEKSFATWTDNWLDGTDRTAHAAAHAAAYAAHATSHAADVEIDFVAIINKNLKERKNEDSKDFTSTP